MKKTTILTIFLLILSSLLFAQEKVIRLSHTVESISPSITVGFGDSISSQGTPLTTVENNLTEEVDITAYGGKVLGFTLKGNSTQNCNLLLKISYTPFELYRNGQKVSQNDVHGDIKIITVALPALLNTDYVEALGSSVNNNVTEVQYKISYTKHNNISMGKIVLGIDYSWYPNYSPKLVAGTYISTINIEISSLD